MDILGPAFFGALFAFIFMWVWDAIKRHNDRWAKHYTGLVKLGRLLNDQLYSITRAIAEIDEIVKAFREAETTPGTIPISANRPEEIPIDRSFEYDIVNLDILNDYMSHYYTIQNINRDIERLMGVKEGLETGLAEGRLKHEDYLGNLRDLVQWLGYVRVYMMAGREDATELLAKTRVRIQRDNPRFHRVSMKFRRTAYESNFLEAAAEEKTKLLSEIDTNLKVSSARTKRLMGGWK